MTKRKPKEEKKREGRPSVITTEVIRKLEEAFALGCTDLEACIYADIGKTAFYEYCALEKDFAERKEQLKETPVLKARRVVIDALDKDDKETAKWYLERKRKNEFSAKQEHSIEAKVNIVVANEEDAELIDGI